MQIIEKSTETSRGPIFVRDRPADGPTVVMLHGSSSSGRVFERQFDSPALAPFRLVAIDLPGHGRSSDARDPGADYTIRGVTSIVAEVFEHLGLEAPVVLGWSLGGHVGLQLAASGTQLSGLMLTGTPPVTLGPLGLLRGFNTNWDMLLATKRQFSERDVERFYRLSFANGGSPAFEDDIRRADGTLRVNFFRSLMHGEGADQRRFVETSALPLAILNGEHEPFARLNYVDALNYRNLWHGRCHRIPATGHSPFWHCPELFNPFLGSFAAHASGHHTAGQGHRHVA